MSCFHFKRVTNTSYMLLMTYQENPHRKYMDKFDYTNMLQTQIFPIQTYDKHGHYHLNSLVKSMWVYTRKIPSWNLMAIQANVNNATYRHQMRFCIESSPIFYSNIRILPLNLWEDISFIYPLTEQTSSQVKWEYMRNAEADGHFAN